MTPDPFVQRSAALMLARLDASDGSEHCGRLIPVHDPSARSAVLGQTFRRQGSSYPDWYSQAVSAGFDGEEIREVLRALSSGCEPNMKRREARAIAEHIDGARRSGDPDAWIEAQEGRADGQGGGASGRLQARIRAGGEAVSRFTLRLPAPTFQALSRMAAARGVSVNALLLEAAERLAAEDSTPLEGPDPF